MLTYKQSNKIDQNTIKKKKELNTSKKKLFELDFDHSSQSNLFTTKQE